jgi:hypothetical protein
MTGSNVVTMRANDEQETPVGTPVELSNAVPPIPLPGIGRVYETSSPARAVAAPADDPRLVSVGP